jgi:hypothetical protein
MGVFIEEGLVGRRVVVGVTVVAVAVGVFVVVGRRHGGLV